MRKDNWKWIELTDEVAGLADGEEIIGAHVEDRDGKIGVAVCVSVAEQDDTDAYAGHYGIVDGDDLDGDDNSEVPE